MTSVLSLTVCPRRAAARAAPSFSASVVSVRTRRERASSCAGVKEVSMANFFANESSVGSIGGGGVFAKDIAGRPSADSRSLRRESKDEMRARVCAGLYAGE